MIAPRQLFLYFVLKISIPVVAFGSTTASSCVDLFAKPSQQSSPITSKNGFYLTKIQPNQISAPKKDYRLYLYPLDVLKSRVYMHLRNIDVEAVVHGQNLEYLYSVYASSLYLSEVAFFKTSGGQIFGISHVELFGGSFILNSLEKSREILEEITKVVIEKKIDPMIGAKFTDSHVRTLWNERFDVTVPLLKDPSLKLFSLNSKNGRLLAVRSFESNGLQVEIMETIGEQYTKPLVTKAEGHSLQMKFIDEVLDFVFPLYVERRGWSEAFVKELRKKAHETADSTKYIVIRDPITKKIIASIGLSRAPYGKAVFRNESNWNWVETIGSFGSTVYQDGLGPRFPQINMIDTPAPVLPMEAYLSLRLPRPAVMELVTRSYKNSTMAALGQPGPNSALTPSAFDPFIAGSGIIFEPTKFAIDKDIESRGLAHALVMKELFSAVFDLRYRDDFLLDGQALYTYNDVNGVRLYRTMGFEPLPGPTIQKDGMDWTVLSLSPQRLLNVLKRHSPSIAQFSKELSKELERSISLLLEQQYKKSQTKLEQDQ